MDTVIGPVPETWQRLLLREACAVQAGPSGTLYRTADPSHTGHPMIRPRDVKDNRIAVEGIGMVDATDTKAAYKLDHYRLEVEDIVYVRIGASRGHALAGPDHHGWLYGSGCLRLRLHNGARDTITARYLNHYLGQAGVREWLARHTSGVAITTVTSPTLSALPLVVPPLATQYAVADVLDALDEKITVHGEISRTTAAVRDTLAPALLTGALQP
jgi:restriction endonuclease S subunit